MKAREVLNGQFAAKSSEPLTQPDPPTASYHGSGAAAQSSAAIKSPFNRRAAMFALTSPQRTLWRIRTSMIFGTQACSFNRWRRQCGVISKVGLSVHRLFGSSSGLGAISLPLAMCGRSTYKPTQMKLQRTETELVGDWISDQYGVVRDPVRYSITSSAVARSVCGMLMPSVLAVLRLITNSYFSGCWIGSSAGLVPLRMRST